MIDRDQRFSSLSPNMRKILDGETIRDAESMEELREFWEAGRHVVEHTTIDQVLVSTVFLGPYTNPLGADQMACGFETMLFDDDRPRSPLHLRQFRSMSLTQARQIHKAACDLVTAFLEAECSTPASPSTPTPAS